MDLPDSSCDVILLFLGPMLLPDPPRGLAEIRRVLRPGGLSAFLTPQDFHQYDIIDEAKHLIVQARPSNLSEEERWRGIPFKRFRDSPMMRTWGQLSFVQDKVAKAGFTRVKGTVVNGMSVIQPNEVATFVSFFLARKSPTIVYSYLPLRSALILTPQSRHAVHQSIIS